MNIINHQAVHAQVIFKLLTLSECEEAIYGCTYCGETSTSSGTFVMCYLCLDGLYALNNNTFSSYYPTQYSFCVPDCQLAHPSYVNNDIIGWCSWCGEHCSSCNAKYGCENCQAEKQQVGWVTGSTSILPRYPGFLQCQDAITYSSAVSDPYCSIYDYFDGLNCALYYDTANCKDASGYFYCNVCTYGYDETVYLGYSICYRCLAHNNFYPEAARCLLLVDPTYSYYYQDHTTGCRDGYLDPNTNLCVANCGTGRFGVATYNFRATMETSQCYSCSSNCTECTEQNQCKACAYGYYLYTGSTSKTTGTCLPKSGTYTGTIYVTPTSSQNYNSADSIDGSYWNPMNSVQDAMVRAYELGAPYSSATITIYLLWGTHYMMRYYPQDFYMPKAYDKDSQTTQIIIDSYNGNEITINYKLRSAFKFKVGAGLTLKNLKFNAIDSSIDIYTDLSTGTSCTESSSSNCCSFNSYGDLLGGASCIFRQQPYQQSYLFLQSCKFWNFNYEFGSFIELNDYGAIIDIKSSEFDTINSCGALIRNKRYTYKKTNSPFNDFVSIYNERSNNLQNELYNKLHTFPNGFNPFSSSCSKSPGAATPCFSISIDYTNLQYFNIMKKWKLSPTYVDPTYKMQYQGYILDLDNFQGPIKFTRNNVNNNAVRYNNCYLGKMIDQNSPNEDNYPSYGTKTQVQIKSLISLVNHGDYPVDILRNTFQQNSGVKGIIYMDMQDRTTNGRVIFGHNTFNSNGGYFDNNVIYIRARGPSSDSVYTRIPTAGNLFCTGYHFEQNTFKYNYGCAQTAGGAIYLECVDFNQPDDTYNGRINYQGLDAATQNSYYNIDMTQHTANTVSYTYNSYTYNVDVNKNMFTYNTYQENYATYSKGLITVVGSPRTYFVHETFIGNGDASYESTYYRGQQWYVYSSYSSEYYASDIWSDPSFDQTLLATSQIKIQRTSQVVFYDVSFDYIWYYETAYSTDRAIVAYFQDFYGEFKMDQISVQDVWGAATEYVYTNLNIDTSTMTQWQYEATMLPLFRFQPTDKVKHIDHFLTGGQLKYLYFYESPDNTDSVMLFDYKTNGEVYSAQTLNINNVQFKQVNFYRATRAPFSLSGQSITMTNCSFQSIGAYGKSNGLGGGYQSLVQVTLKKPYINSASTLIVETLTIDQLYSDTNYYDSGSRLFSFIYQSIIGEQEPTSTQISIINSYISNTYNEARKGGIIYCNVNTIRMSMNNVTFINSTTSYTASLTSYGGIIYADSLGGLSMTSVTATDFTAKQTSSSNGGGRFIYLNQNQSFVLQIQSSTFTCQPSPTYNYTTIQTRVSSNLYNQGTCFHLNTGTQSLSLTSNISTFQNCSIAYDGGIFMLTSSSSNKSISLSHNIFSRNAALYGGTASCVACSWILTNNSFLYGVAKYGGDIYIEDPQNNIVFDSLVAQYSVGIIDGGFAYLYDSQSVPRAISFINSNGPLSSYNTIYAKQSGGLVYAYVYDNFDVTISNTIFQTINATNSGGLIYIEEDQYGDLLLRITNSSLTSIKALNYYGGAIYSPKSSGASNVDISYTSISAISSGKDGGLIYLGGITTQYISFSSVILTNCISGANGGVIYALGADNTLILTQNTQISNTTASTNGGFSYLGGTGTIQYTMNNASISTSMASTGDGGIAFISGTTTTIDISLGSSISASSAALNGGAFSVYSDTISLTTSGLTLSSVSANQSGGAFYLYSTTSVAISFNQSSFTSSSSSYNGGLINIDSPSQTISMDQINLSNIQSISGKGGVLYSSQNSTTVTMFMNNIDAKLIKAASTGSFYSIDGSKTPLLDITIQNSSYSCMNQSLWSSWPNQYNSIIAKLDASTSDIGGLFYNDDGATGNIVSSNNTFKECYATSSGTSFYLGSGMTLTDTSSTFKQNAGLLGQIYCDSCNLTFMNSIFKDQVAQYASIAYLFNSANLLMDGVSLSQGKSRLDGGAIYAEGTGNASIRFQNCASNLEYFSAGQNGGFMTVDNPNLLFSSFNCSWQHLNSLDKGGFIHGLSLGDFSISQCLMVNITSGNSGSFISANGASGFNFMVNQCTFQCKTTYNSTNVTASLQGNGSTSIGSLFELNNANSVSSSQNTFSNCYTSQAGSIFNLGQTIFTDDSSIFQQNSALQGGVFKLSSVQATLNNSTFTQNSAMKGGSFYIEGQSSLQLTDLITTSSKSTSDGGFIYLQEPTQNVDIIMNGTSSIITVQSGQNGGFAYFDAPYLNFQIYGANNVFNSYAQGKGGFAYIINSNDTQITDATFQNITSLNSGSVIYSTSLGTFEIQNSIFDCMGTSNGSFNSQLNSQTALIGGAFYLKDSSGIQSQLNTVQNCYLGNVGGAYYLENTTMTDTSSIYQNNAAIKGGAFYCKSCMLQTQNDTFTDHQAYQGGVFYLQDSINLIFDQVSVLNAYSAKNGGMAFVIETNNSAPANQSQITFLNTAQITNTSSVNNGGAFFIDHSRLDIFMNTVITLSNSIVTTGSGGVFYILRGQKLEILGSSFQNFSSSTSGSFLYSQSSTLNLTIKNNIFDSQSVAWSDPTPDLQVYTQGGSFYILNDTIPVASQHNIFQNNYDTDQGGSFSLVGSTLNDIGSTFKYNRATTGGAIYCSRCTLSIDSSIFDSNEAFNGGTFYINNHQNSLNATNISITNSQSYNYGGSFYIAGSSLNSMTFDSLKINQTSSILDGGLMFLNNTRQSIIFNNLILDQSTSNTTGGAFYILNAENITFETATITRTSAPSKGSFMYAQANTMRLLVQNSILICLNQAFIYATDLSGKIDSTPPQFSIGGAFYIKSAISVISNINIIKNCYVCDQGSAYSLYSTVFTDSNSIYQSHAAIFGGVIYADKSSLTISASTFTDQFANIGGVFYTNNLCPTDIQNVNFTNSQSVTNGGLAFQTQPVTPTGSYSISYKYCRFIDIYGGSNGGSFYIDSSQITQMSFFQVIFTNSSASASGGIFQVNNIGGQIIISSDTASGLKSTFTTFSATSYGSFLYSTVAAFSLNITDSLIQCKSSYSSGTVQSQLTQSTQNFAGAFYVSSSSNGVYSENNIYRNCYTASYGGQFTLIRTTMTDISSQFYQNAALSGGVFKCDSCTLNANNSKMTDNNAADGGVFLFDNQATLNANDVEISSNQAISKGGALSVVKSSLNTLSNTQLTFTNCNSIYDNTADIGGLVNIENKYISLLFDNSVIYDISADSQGGVIYVQDANIINITNSDLYNFEAPDGSFLYSASQNLILEFYRSSFECNTTLDKEDILTYLDLEEPKYMFSSVMFISNAKNIKSSYSMFELCGVTQQGGVFKLLSTQFQDYKSTFQNNAAAQGGVISCQFTTMDLEQSTFQNNYAATGGAISLQSSSVMTLTKVAFESNLAYSSGGVLYISTESYFNATNCDFLQNYAEETSTIDVLGSSSINNITIDSCNFESNSAQKNTISLMYSNVIIKNSQFQYNSATSRTKNIFCGFSSIYVYSSQFKSQSVKNPQERVKNELTLGTYFFVIFDVKLHVWDSQFIYGQASIGGAMYISGDSNIYIYGSNFYNNYAKTYGGAIYGSGFSELYIGAGSQFKNNLALENGDDFYITNTESKMTLDTINVTNPVAKTSLYAETVSLKLYKAFFNNIYGLSSSKGGALTCVNCRSINITKSSFRNMSSTLGGAIYIEESENNKKTQDKYGKYQIISTTFINCSATTGGAIYASNPQYLTINSSIFRNNSVYYDKNAASLTISGAGGAIYYTCDDVNLKCAVDLKKQNNFTGNYAGIKGGAIYWDVLEPQFSWSDITFMNNSAKQYADNIGCFAQQLSIINKTYYNEKMIELGLLDPGDVSRRMLDDGKLNEASATVSEQRSGGNIPNTYLAHIDKYGQIVGSDFTSKVRVLVNATSNLNASALVYPPIIEGTTQFDAQGGMIQVKDLSFAGTPGYSYSIIFTTDGIDLNKKSNKDFMSQLGGATDLDFDIKIKLRECEIGEQFTSAGKCIQCADGTSYSLVKMTSPGSCLECPSEKAVCYGGSNVGPKAGYWRKNNSTSDFIKCLYQPACLGMIPPENNPQGSCLAGYEGILCTDCQVGYSRTGDYECSYCPEPVVNIIRLSFIFIAVVLLLIFMIRSTLSGAKEKNNVTSIFMKILLNHMQLILLTASFDFDWPEKVVELFDTAKPVASVSTQIISFDCFLDSRGSNSTSGKVNSTSSGIGVRIFFQKLVMLALLPFLLAVFSYIVWRLIKLCQKNSALDVQSRAMSTIVIVLFLVHPSIVQYMFYDFKCMDVDGESRVQDDLEVICWNSEHKLFSYFIALPSIIVWGLGIPFFAFLLISKVRDQLESLNIREKYGFLYRGYRKDFYYWEIIIMYRKITLIFISVFIISFGVIAQALIVFMVLICFLIVNSKKKPFATMALNDLETLSLVTSMITVYCGLFFITDKPEKWIQDNPDYSNGALHLGEDTKLFFFAVICISNLVFVIYWTYKMYEEVKAKFRAKMPYLYLAVCLCFNKKKLQEELISHQVHLENEGFREEYFKRLKQMKKLYYSGQLILTRNTMERVLHYLDLQRLIQASGMIEREDPDLIGKTSKRFNRVRVGQEQNRTLFNGEPKIHDAGQLGLLVGLDQQKSKQNQDDVDDGPLNDEYYNYEKLANQGFREGKMKIPPGKGYLGIDEAFLGDETPDQSSTKINRMHSRNNSNSVLINEEFQTQSSRMHSASGGYKKIKQQFPTNLSLIAPDSTRSLNSNQGFFAKDKLRKNTNQTRYNDSLNFSDNNYDGMEVEQESIGFTLSDEETRHQNLLQGTLDKKQKENDLLNVMRRGNKKMINKTYNKKKQKQLEKMKTQNNKLDFLKDEQLERKDSIEREIDIDLEDSEVDDEQNESQEPDNFSQQINKGKNDSKRPNSGKILAKKVTLNKQLEKRKTIKNILERELINELNSKLGIVKEVSDESPHTDVSAKKKKESPHQRSNQELTFGIKPINMESQGTFNNTYEPKKIKNKFSNSIYSHDIISEEESKDYGSQDEYINSPNDKSMIGSQIQPQQQRNPTQNTTSPEKSLNKSPIKIDFLQTDENDIMMENEGQDTYRGDN